MAGTLNIPDEPRTKSVDLKVSTKKTEDGQSKESTFKAALPLDLESAVALEGSAKEVLRYYIASKVIELQGEERAKLERKAPGEGRKKAAYLEELGF